ncbi:MAG: hypothetical protein PWR21_2067 [Methanoculleus sp.]|nr:hypothetical protein [Methanoculleus sp.]
MRSMTDIRFGTIVSAVLECLDFAESDLTADERHDSRKALERYKAEVAQTIREVFDEAGVPTPVAPPVPTYSRCGSPVKEGYRFCTRCRMPQTVEAAGEILEKALAKDAGMTPDDPRFRASLARIREEQPEQWDTLIQMLTTPAKA